MSEKLRGQRWSEQRRVLMSSIRRGMHVRADNGTGFKGVRLKAGRFYARIKTPEGMKYLGNYATPEQAAHVYDMAARRYFGKDAALNFPILTERGAR